MNAKDWAEEKERVEEMELVLRVDGERERAERVRACLQRVEALERAVRRLREVIRDDGCSPGKHDYDPDGCPFCQAVAATVGLVEEEPDSVPPGYWQRVARFIDDTRRTLPPDTDDSDIEPAF